jgi:parallel beta-helix repeat protein
MATTIPSGFPNATNTGATGTLTAYTGPMTVSGDGVVIENKIINGSLRVTGDNVVIKNCTITYNTWWGIDADGAKNITIQDCTIIGPGNSADSNAGILGAGTFLRNDISKSENGIVLLDGASTVKGNYVHDLQDGSSDPHYDGISVQGGQNGVLIEGNTVLGRDTSDIFIKNDFGPISNVTVKGNYLAGNPGYTIYVDANASGGPITGVSIIDNYVQKGFYGYYSIEKSSPVVSGNHEFLPGATIPDPTPDPT